MFFVFFQGVQISRRRNINKATNTVSNSQSRAGKDIKWETQGNDNNINKFREVSKIIEHRFVKCLHERETNADICLMCI